MWQVHTGQALSSDNNEHHAHESVQSCRGGATYAKGGWKGCRIEELTELTHHSLVQYRLPNSGELVPLLHIAPSKTDIERLLPID